MRDKTPYTNYQIECLSRINIEGICQAKSLNGIEVRDDANGHAFLIDGVCYMTTTPPDLLDHLSILNEASGSVLLTGLGMGLGIIYADRNPKITSVTCLEIDQRVINLIAPMILPHVKRLTPNIMLANADFYDATGFDFAYLDHAYARISDESEAHYRRLVPNVKIWFDERIELDLSWRSS